jgi:two-component system cell cycle response regulator
VVPVAAAAVLSVLVASRATGQRRRLWRLLAASNVLWLGGDLVWATYAYVLHGEAPFPSVADGLYLLSYVLVPPAVLAGFGGASGRRRVRAVLDGAVVALVVGTVAWRLLVAPQLGSGMSWATATGIAYPLLGVVIVIVLLTVGPSGHRHVPPSVWVIGLAFAASAVTAAGYTYLSVLHEYLPGAWVNLGWQCEAVLLCLAAVCAWRHEEGDGQVAPLSRDAGLAPALGSAAVALAMAATDAVRHGSSWLYLGAAGVAVLALATRSVLSTGDTRAVALQLDAALREQERLAVTDGLTGLYNRRFFQEVLRLETDRAHRDGTCLALVVADLDHFKHVNDTHGHPSGDAVLAEAAARLKRSLREVDVLARYGGEEFVMILPGADSEVALEVAERCRRALSEDTVRLHSGQRVSITGSFGVACLPADTGEVDALIRLADRALYAAKDAGRDQVLLASHGGPDTLPTAAADVPVAGDRPAELGALELLADIVDAQLGTAEHGVAMARWVGVLADALGLDAAARHRAVLGARLHDVGKIALPDAVLTKQGPLDAPEWALMRTHPDQGARLVTGSSSQLVADIVRGHHERYDGSGYPTGTPSADLSVETRLVSVCDTWAAMRADRPYARARTVEDARQQLLAGRGTQHDPDLVDLFLTLQAAGLVGQLHDHADPAAAATPSSPAHARTPTH